MYDDLADLYDRFINWPQRLQRELPALTAFLGDAATVADLACGTGQHAHALARQGYRVTGFDLSEAALAAARRSAEEQGLAVDFLAAPFGGLQATGAGPFDAAICLGNSLPHLLDRRALRAMARDLAQVLNPGGRFLAHLRNLPLAASRGERWLPLKSHTDPDGTEWLFERSYVFGPSGRVEFTFAALRREVGGDWTRRLTSTPLRAWTADDLAEAFGECFEVEFWGEPSGTPFDEASSADLWLRGRLRTG